MSTLAFASVLALMVIALIAFAGQGRAGRPPQPAMLPIRTGRGARRSPPMAMDSMMAISVERPPADGDERSPRSALRDRLAAALGPRPPQAVVTGKAVRISVLRRIRSILLLAAMLALLGAGLALALGAALLLAGFLIELAIT